jgi:quinol monooxygenase YgiN
MSQTVYAEFPCKEGKGADLVNMLREILPDTRAFEGCESIEVSTGSDNPDDVVIWQRWAARGNHEAYLAWRTETGVFDAVIPMLAGEFRISYLDVHDDV